VLNTKPAVASAAPLGAVLHETIGRGGVAAIPRFPKQGLSESFIDPALRYLSANRAEIRFGARVAALGIEDGRVAGLSGPNLDERIEPTENVILAVPPWVATELVPGLVAPNQFEAILNVHFRARIPAGEAGFYGLLGGTAEWVFQKDTTASSIIFSSPEWLLSYDRHSERYTVTKDRREIARLRSATELASWLRDCPATALTLDGHDFKPMLFRLLDVLDRLETLGCDREVPTPPSNASCGGPADRSVMSAG
jgi:hypothetical protein